MKNYQRRKAFIINGEVKEFKSYTKDGFYYKSTENLWFWKGRKNGKPFEFHAKSIEELNRNTNNHMSFMKRFYALFDAFWVLKFVHFYRDNIMPISNLKDNVNSLLLESNKAILKTELDQLIYFRLCDKKRGLKDPL